MTEAAQPSAPAGATPVASPSVTIPVPSAAVPPTTNTPATPEAAPDKAKTAEPEKSDAQDDQPRGDDGKYKPKQTAEDRKARIQRDIDGLTGAKRQAERQVQELRAQQYRLHQELQQKPADEFDPAQQMRRAIREDRLEDTTVAAQRAAQAADDARLGMFSAKLQAAKERLPDLDDAIAQFAKLPIDRPGETYGADLIAESEKAAEIAYYLAKNPGEAHRIATLPPHMKGAEIARLEVKVSQAPQARKNSNAPPPVPIINGTASPSVKAPHEMSADEISKLIYGRA